MAKKARSARGEVVDFDLIAIKHQLATTPVSTATQNRRRFIDEKDGFKIKTTVVIAQPAEPTPAPIVPSPPAKVVPPEPAKVVEKPQQTDKTTSASK